MNEMNSLTHSCMHSLASLAIFALSGNANFIMRATKLRQYQHHVVRRKRESKVDSYATRANMESTIMVEHLRFM